MKTLLALLILGAFLANCNSAETSSSSKTLESPTIVSNPPNKQPTPSTSTEKLSSTDSNSSLAKYTLDGKITNATVNKEGSVQIFITEIAKGKYKCEGQCDEISLFGRFECYGEKFENPNFPNAVNINFNGQIRFGDGDGSNFNPGTKATFTCNIRIFTDNATGDYTIGEIPNSSWSEKKQNGLLDLSIKSKSRYSVN